MSLRRALAGPVAVALVLAVSPGRAQAVLPDSGTKARSECAAELARLISPHDLLLAGNLVAWEAGVTRSLALDPTIVKLEQPYPGIGKAAIQAARPVARRYCEAFLSRALERMTAVFAQRLTAAEIEESITFYGSALGQSMVRGLLAKVDAAALGREAAARGAETGVVRISPEEVRAKERDAGKGVTDALSAAEQVELTRYSVTPAAHKFSEVRLEADRQIIEMANHPNPKWLEEQSQVMRQAIVAYVDARKKI